MGGMGEDGFEQDDEGGDFGEGSGMDTEGGESGADDEAWGELEDRQGEGGATVEKSFAKKRAVRIVI
jgi:hypothetical protein